MAKMGRKYKEIDKSIFENLCALQCTITEIAFAFETSTDTLNDWCRRNYKDENGKPMTFSQVYKIKNVKGKIALRRQQMKLAEKYPSMSIWLGKQYLQQSDNGTTEDLEDVDSVLDRMFAKANGEEE